MKILSPKSCFARISKCRTASIQRTGHYQSHERDSNAKSFEINARKKIIDHIRRTGVPNSCIESAEYIIRSVHKNSSYQWKPTLDNVPTETPHVYAVFGGNRYFNVSDDANWLKKIPSNLQDFPFGHAEMPDIGEGLCLVKFTEGNNTECDYDMHFGAILSKGLINTEISNNCEPPVKVKMGSLAVYKIRTPADFRDTIAGAVEGSFALGKLTTNLPNGATQLT